MKKIVMCFLMIFLTIGIVTTSTANTPDNKKSNIIVINDTSKTQIVWVKWISNPYSYFPITIACAEMTPGKEWKLSAGYPSDAGVFDVIWQELDRTRDVKRKWIGFRVVEPPSTFYLKHDTVTRSDGIIVEQKSGWED